MKQLGLVLLLFGLAAENKAQMARSDMERPRPLLLTEGWAYRFSTDTSAVTAAALLADTTGWTPTRQTYGLPNPTEAPVLWLRMRLPDRLPRNPAVGTYQALYAVQIFLDTDKIYEEGVFREHPSNKYALTRPVFVPLRDEVDGGKWMYFRLFSATPDDIGLKYQVWLASEHVLLTSVARPFLPKALLGGFLAVMGLVSLILSFYRSGQPEMKTLLFFGLFSFFSGAHQFAETTSAQIIIDAPALWYYVLYPAFYLFPVGLLGFFDEVMTLRKHTAVYYCQLVHLVFALIVIALDLLKVAAMPTFLSSYFVLLFVSAAVILRTSHRRYRNESRSIQAFLLGGVVLSVTGLYDTLAYNFTLLPQWMPLYTLGLLFFTLCLVYLVEQAFTEQSEKLQSYSTNLEQQSEALLEAKTELEAYSASLEAMVEARTEDLQLKNADLGDALQMLKQTQQQLIVREKLASLGNLTAGIAHEIKNPLNFVNNFSELSLELTDELAAHVQQQRSCLPPEALEEIETLVDDLKQSAQKVRNHGKRANSIVQNMLLHARGTGGEREQVDINAHLEECVNLAYHGMRAAHPGFQVELQRAYAPDLPPLNVIPQELGRVFLNLLNNAFYAINEASNNPEKPRVTITTEQVGQAVQIHVADNGPGIPPAVKQRVFEPFFTTKPAGKGTGLGLSLSHDIIANGHGGTLTVASEPGAGATFTITLPVQAR